jgi:hypothetical protein
MIERKGADFEKEEMLKSAPKRAGVRLLAICLDAAMTSTD